MLVVGESHVATASVHPVATAGPLARIARIDRPQQAWKRESRICNSMDESDTKLNSSDASVLSRLVEVETRMKALEELLRESSHRAVSTLVNEASAPENGLTKPPELHTAAGCKLLQCWPHIRLNNTIPNITAHTYLSEADESDPLLLQSSSLPTSLGLWQISRAIEELYDTGLPHLPLSISELLYHCPGLSKQTILLELEERFSFGSVAGKSTAVDIEMLLPRHALILSIALRSASHASLDTDQTNMTDIAAATFATALKNQWLILSNPDEEGIPLTLLSACSFLTFWARPFHALGMLQSIDPALRGFCLRHKSNPCVIPLTKMR